MTEHGASTTGTTEAPTGKGRIGVYVLLVFLAIVASLLITFDALSDDVVEYTDQLDPTTLEDAPD